MLQLGQSDKFLTVSEWQGVTRVHIRHYMQKDGLREHLIPTKKGVALTIEEWKCLKSYIDYVDHMLHHGVMVPDGKTCSKREPLAPGMTTHDIDPILNKIRRESSHLEN